ncbi:thioredoxin family protein [Kordiimonas sediminis]|uniref:thioredoxin family protein n=1 Tax=Kordiimonas sediminis TaxID=1735581 RepID=UPI00174A7C83|nr:thioredoxin family protein [Kordiimonas sediminis]
MSVLTAVSAPALLSPALSAADDIRFDSAAFDPDTAFAPSASIMADVDATLAIAKKEGKLAALILGANWCHDSRGLAKHFTDPAVASLLAKHYAVKFLDVGYLEKGVDVANRFGLPVYYGTPTLLVVDPATETLLNKDNVYLWRDSYSMKMEDVRASIEAMATSKPVAETVPDNPALQDALASIDAFEEKHARRIEAAFSVVGPMLKAYKDGKTPENFENYWGELRELRYGLTDDVTALRQGVWQRYRAGDADLSVTFPEYPAFSWE